MKRFREVMELAPKVMQDPIVEAGFELKAVF